MFPFDLEAQEVSGNPHGARVPMGPRILCDPGVDSQDSGLGDPEAGPREDHTQEPARQKGEPSKHGSRRDPRRQSVMLASPSTLFGEGNGSGPNTGNISQQTPSASLMEEADALMDKAGWEPQLVIDIESE